jgi:hypothetical protein
MNESRLDQDLKTLATRPGPNLPSDFNAMVWSKVQMREKAFRAVRENWLQKVFSALVTPQWAAVGFALAIFTGWMLGRTTTNPGASPTETRLAGTVTGEVIDIACYFESGACGPEHAACASMCIASGLPVGLKAKDGRVYVLIGKPMLSSAGPVATHETVNAQLAPYAAKIVTISGTIVSKKGVSVIENAEIHDEQARWQQSPDRTTDSKTHFTHFLQEQLASAINPDLDSFR